MTTRSWIVLLTLVLQSHALAAALKEGAQVDALDVRTSRTPKAMPLRPGAGLDTVSP
jgi:hypothetical protein